MTLKTQIYEVEQELRTTHSLARTSSTGRGRMRSNAPEPLAYRFGPLPSEAKNVAPTAPSSDLRERLGTTPPNRRQHLGSRLGRPNDRNQTSFQPSTSASNLPATVPIAKGSLSINPAPAERAGSTNVLLWNRPDPGAWGQYKANRRD